MEKSDEIMKILKKNKEGLTITDIVKKCDYSRSTVRNILAKLEGAKKVAYIEIGMAKLYSLK